MQEEVIEPPETVPMESEATVYGNSMIPIAFAWDSGDPVTSTYFESYRDSIILLVGQDDILEITGIRFREEHNNAHSGDLGMLRALAVQRLFAYRIPIERTDVKSTEHPGDAPVEGQLFEAIEFNIVSKDVRVEKLQDRVIIYFPFNSTNPITNRDIDKYLNELAIALQNSSDSVTLVGHSDAFGPAEENYTLALWRAGAIREMLVSRGVDASRISVESRGEDDPIAPNDVPANAAKNRRVEVILNK